MLPPLVDAADTGELRIAVDRISVFGDVLDRTGCPRRPPACSASSRSRAIPTTDCGYIAQQAPGEPGLYLNDDLLVVEPVDADDQPVERGQMTDHLLVTSLHQRSLPLIRYRIDDRVTFDQVPGRYPRAINGSPTSTGAPTTSSTIARSRFTHTSSDPCSAGTSTCATTRYTRLNAVRLCRIQATTGVRRRGPRRRTASRPGPSRTCRPRRLRISRRCTRTDRRRKAAPLHRGHRSCITCTSPLDAGARGRPREMAAEEHVDEGDRQGRQRRQGEPQRELGAAA